MHQVIAFSCRFWGKCKELKAEYADCEVYKKPDVKKLTQCKTGKLLRSNHNDQYLYLA